VDMHYSAAMQQTPWTLGQTALDRMQQNTNYRRLRSATS